MKQINLELPIEIRKTVNENGYVITDANKIEYFFYEKEEDSQEMIYDGLSVPVKSFEGLEPIK